MKRASVAAGPRIGFLRRRLARGRRRLWRGACAVACARSPRRPWSPARAGRCRGSLLERRRRSRRPCARPPEWRWRRRCHGAAPASPACSARPPLRRAARRRAPHRARCARRTVPVAHHVVGLREDLDERAGDRARAARRRPCRWRSPRGPGRARPLSPTFFEPLEHGALGDRLAHLGHGDVDDLAVAATASVAFAAWPLLGVGAVLGLLDRGLVGRRRRRRRVPAAAAVGRAAVRARSRRARSRRARSRPAGRGSRSGSRWPGEGTSVSTLSVETSTIPSSSSTASPDLLEPLEDRSLGHRFAHLGHGDLDGRAGCHRGVSYSRSLEASCKRPPLWQRATSVG